MVVRLSASRTGCTLLPRNIFFLMFPVLIYVRGWVNCRALVQPEGLGKFKISPCGDTTPTNWWPRCDFEVIPMWFEHTVHHSQSTFHDFNCCRSDRPKSTYHSGHNTSHRLGPPAHGSPPTRSIGTLLGLIHNKDRNCIMSFSGRTPRTTLWRFLTADLHTDAAPCAQPAHHRAERKDYTGSHIPRRWFQDRPHFNRQYNGSHSIISYTTTDSDHQEYTLLSVHSLCTLTFILLREELYANLQHVGNTVD
jgi:hypothetical protein